DPGVLLGVLEGHSDAIWALAFNPPGDLLASCSADGSLRLWHPRGHQGPPLATFDAQRVVSEVPKGHPKVPSLVPNAPKGHPRVTRCPQGSPQGPQMSPRSPHWSQVFPSVTPGQVNQVVAHPCQPLSITASDDRSIRVLDNRTAVRICYPNSTTRADVPLTVPSLCPLCSPLPDFCHLSAPSGHDCSLRLWHLGQGSCVQELPAHRRKHSEAVLAVAFHCHLPLAASAGADGLAKVFV
ncbi:STRN4 protein, partial [Eubucco bourcierii]|nr:STRN4 protein [Eubucco bourcierii]